MKKHYFAYEMFSKYRGAIMGIQILLIVFFHFTEDCKGYRTLLFLEEEGRAEIVLSEEICKNTDSIFSGCGTGMDMAGSD